jgi:hypothetical protein
MTTRPTALLASTLVAAAALLTFAPTAGAQDQPTTFQPPSCLVVTFTIPDAGPQILRSRADATDCADVGYVEMVAAADATAAVTCAGVTVQGDLAPKVSPWSGNPLNALFPVDVSGTLSNVHRVGTKDCTGPPAQDAPPRPSLPCQEDDDCWDCETMGNMICGAPALLAAADTGGTIAPPALVPLPEVTTTSSTPMAPVAAAASRSLAVTGAHTGILVTIAAALLVVGAALLTFVGGWRRASAKRPVR